MTGSDECCSGPQWRGRMRVLEREHALGPPARREPIELGSWSKRSNGDVLVRRGVSQLLLDATDVALEAQLERLRNHRGNDVDEETHDGSNSARRASHGHPSTTFPSPTSSARTSAYSDSTTVFSVQPCCDAMACRRRVICSSRLTHSVSGAHEPPAPPG